MEGMPVILRFADTDFFDPGPDLVHIDEQADIDAIVIIELYLLKDGLFPGDHPAERLAEFEQVREEEFEHRLDEDLGDAARGAFKIRFHKVGLIFYERRRKEADNVL